MKLFKNLYSYRELLKTNIKKEIRGKYKGSFLGVLWSFINPLLQTLVYAIVFPYIMRTAEEHYLIYLVIGILPWTFFTSSVFQGLACVRVNAGIIKKVYFPREILPISVVASGLVNFSISCIVMFLFVIFGGIGLSFYMFLLPFIILLQSIFTLGIVFGLSAINIYIKDTEYIMQFIINMLMYGTPILYSITLFPENVRWILYLNPFTHFVNAYRDIMMYHRMPDLQSLGMIALVSVVVLFVGGLIFKKLEKGFVEEL